MSRAARSAPRQAPDRRGRRRLTAIDTTVRDLRRDLDEAQAGVRTSTGGAVRQLGNQLGPLTQTVRRLNRALDQAGPATAALERRVGRGWPTASARQGRTSAELAA